MAPNDPSLRRWGRLALVAAGAVFLLIVLGGVVRISGSGMGCGPDWPKCNGRWFPPMDLETFIEWFHRLVAAGVSGLVAAVALHAWWPGRGEAFRGPRRVAAASLALLAVQVMLGAVTVWLELPPATVVLHLGTAMALFAVLLGGGTAALASPRRPERDGISRTGWTTAWAALGVVLLGALVANLDAAPACQGFPLCNGELLPAGGWRIHLHWTHRLAAYALAAWVLWLPVWVSRVRPGDPAARRAAGLAALLVAGQVVVGAVMVLEGLPLGLRAAHLGLGTALFGTLLVGAWFLARPPAGVAEARGREEELSGTRGRPPERADGPAGARGSSGPVPAGREGEAGFVPSGACPEDPLPGLAAGLRRRLSDYVTLTKPRIISLLLVTTVVPMFVAGDPGLWLVLGTVVGGYLMAGGANALNMYLDRDIDGKMRRTCTRPVPGGRMGAGHALWFGVGLGATAFFLLAWIANLLAASLALAGLLFYVFVYTRWLKRRTPQNIVIGGAAGAFPPLVGWAAVTGSLDLTAVVFFLIVFYWTPPHFWALALVKKEEYGKAGVPMAPLVWGDRRTVRKMLYYTLVLLPLTLLPVFSADLGVVYGLAALALGGKLLRDVAGLLPGAESGAGVGAGGGRGTGRGLGAVAEGGAGAVAGGRAMALFHYSLLYLALLFGAMLVDRAAHIPLPEPAPGPVALEEPYPGG